MERGRLTGPIPSTLGLLQNLYFLDLDFNKLTGSIPTSMTSLQNLEQLDLNNNNLTGTLEEIGALTGLVFLQLQNNNFSGTVPASIGSFSGLGEFRMTYSSVWSNFTVDFSHCIKCTGTLLQSQSLLIMTYINMENRCIHSTQQ